MFGALIIDKPGGMTSHDVVARVRKILGERRVGHTGTLDPFATGVLVMLIGRATRLAQFLSGAEKEYEAIMRLGYATDTGDVTGARFETRSHAKPPSVQSLRKVEIQTAMASLTGEIQQVPPMYSAKKIAGRKLYEHARRGEEIERQPVRVTIREFEALPSDNEMLKINDDGSADLRVRVVCSAGTYVRTLAEDLGRQLGAGAHLAALRRTRAGQFSIEQAISLEQLAEHAAAKTLTNILLAPNQALSMIPPFALDEAEARRARHGNACRISDEQSRPWGEGQPVRMTLDGELIAIGKFDAESQTVHPKVVLTDG